ncbi:MAG: TolC family protein, partial [Prevotellaceae bacterium]|nr:TolC family protein [Prevotellaceae bacterium]
MKQYIIVLTVCITLLSGCSIHKPFSHPGLPAGNLYRDADSTGSVNSGNTGWEVFFTDPYLQKLIEKGLQNNTDMKTAHLRVEQSEAVLRMAKLAFLPSANIPLQGVTGSFDGGKANRSYSLPVAASWEIDVFGRLHNSRKRAAAALEQTKEYRQAVRTGMIAAIANIYYSLLLLDGQLEVTEQTARNWKNSMETMRELKKAGMANEAAVSQSEANYYSIEASLHDLKYRIYGLENSLSVILGEAPHTIERGKLDGQQLPEHLTVGIPLQTLGNRPDVKSAELSLEQAYYATNETRAAFYPSLTLNGSAGWTNLVGNTIVNPGSV